ncbi:acyl-CoA dehydrogenase family protein [Amycolatopsis acidiphila]|uniref:Acyl-CoA dehydrogenase n=1 Tax=Amycolatopsis acidiphila TaxID=715473 RepID=A0A557ZYS9_9PSEU|nr:acyl-CoA dehydrogenase family protein [Amycolatopsis acidiphila]TVT17160.1 acyl-CoA dehydrogenase [Amycolatopsis acidiphila]UIJ63081.1 acyl-CoA dehydrogenase family protein [Amycolatopsis acidiphila]GHG66021.1 acyl-CoA dehydrogenase [Amycolatopsis acidiphila]
MDETTFGQVLDAVRQFVRKEVVPRENEIEETDSIPDDLRAATAELGLFGYALPAEYGGLGALMAEDVRLAFEFGYTTPAFRSLFGTNNGIAGQVIAKFGTEAQKQAFLPRLASGEAIASFALTESEAGSSPAGLKTSARRDGSDWVVTGTKRFITNAPLADLFVVFARTDPTAAGGRGISAFAVDAPSPGLTVGPRDHKMGQRGAWTAEVMFDEVRVPGDRLIGEEGRGYRSAMTVLARGRLHIAAMCVGTAQRILDESVQHAGTSRQGGRPIGDHQLVQAMLADSYAELAAGRSLVLHAAAEFDSGADIAAGPSSAKLFCSEMVSRVADRGVQIHGGMGYMAETVVERMYRDSRLYRLYEGTSEIQKLIIARELLSPVARS